ncbi:hypothetical protein [Chryseobacterium sp.]|uniref:hypothetical protein n=1 Tax=Chryseobacterium sp. TaxID=1871047 RepID=UPI0011C9C5A9|nr:hypothetical protein [Chryseobacterium sp.]TXF76034.1 hypothetical protein FUA25_09040 [Chryseobacterium sp.]
MKTLLPYSVFFLLITSCAVKRADVDFIEFNHKNYTVIKDDRINIKLIPTTAAREKNVSVRIVYKSEQLDRIRITAAEYNAIKAHIHRIKQEDLEMPRIVNKGEPNEFVMGIPDGGSNSISISENNTIRKFATSGFIKQYHLTFYDAVEKIFSTVGIELEDL